MMMMMMMKGTAAVFLLLSVAPVTDASVMSPYDPSFCYILDGFLLLYGIIITAFFVRERFIVKRNKADKNSLYEPINKSNRSEYDMMRDPEGGAAGRRRGDDTYTPLKRQTDDTYRKIEPKPDRRRGDQVYQGLSSMTKDTYDSLHMQQLHPPR
ncbi:T-cell surface glycoprotein CD3 zeta chain [Xyrauchen texanus]|uniref:T-cell surface glycoprotein CD3 zeta chain n=1 Tax=Xyrauchen texanus TaxID=154827 RepID=UPI0022423063|nr:T-cell surface glycoprotein CD3 zeta chain [Xyrauchen texanus]